jgi:hypothetical protein
MPEATPQLPPILSVRAHGKKLALHIDSYFHVSALN